MSRQLKPDPNGGLTFDLGAALERVQQSAEDRMARRLLDDAIDAGTRADVAHLRREAAGPAKCDLFACNKGHLYYYDESGVARVKPCPSCEGTGLRIDRGPRNRRARHRSVEGVAG